MLQEIQISSFTAGELSPRMKGRTDYQRYYDSLDTCRNMVPMPQGGLAKRPGTLYVAAAIDQTATPFRVRNLPFEFSTVQPYSLEFGPGYIKPFMADSEIVGVTILTVPYAADEIWQVSYCQSADTLWLAHPNYPLATVTRSSHTAWSYQVFPLQDGPYSRPNSNPGTTLTPSGVSGSITFTANSAAGINQDNGFVPTDVGRLLRFYSTDGAAENPVSQWVSCRITAVADTLNITAAVQPASLTCAGFLAGTVAGSSFALGAFSPTLGYPITVGLWQERLALWGWRDIPNAFAASRTGAFDTFGTTEPDGTVTPRDGLFFVLEDDQVNAARWLVTAGSAQTMQLGLGSAGSENILQGATTGQPLSSTNVQAYRETQYGGAAVKPLRVGKVVLFADAPARKLREWQFDWRVNGYIGPDKMQESEHMTRGPAGVPAAQWGLRWMAYQQSPHQVIWAGRNDGGLVSFTYDREQNVWAAAQHQLGGQYWGGPPIVESGCVIPSPDLSYDELWLVVLRTVAGTPRRTIEVMTRFFDALPQEAAWFVDCGLGSTLSPASISCTLAGFAALPPPDGTLAATRPPAWSGTGTLTTPAAAGPWQQAQIGWVVRINGGVLIVTGLTADPYTVAVKATRPLLGLAPGVAGEWTSSPPFDRLTGLGHLVGEEVAILADGADQGRQTVAADGGVSLRFKASLAAAGLPYTPTAITMPFESQKAAFAQSRGKSKRAVHLYLRFYETVGCAFGRRLTDPSTNQIEDVLEPLEFRLPGDRLDVAPPLYSGIKRLNARGGFDREAQVIVTQDGPLPLTLLSINASVEVGDVPANVP